jgi:hypothetical protein
MTLMLLWLRWEMRLRWRSLLVLSLLIAVSKGVVLTAAAGARRGETAVARLAKGSLPATAQVVPLAPDFDWEAVRRLPQVADLALLANSSFAIDGVSNPYAGGQPPINDAAMRTVERPHVIAGRLPDRERVTDVASVQERLTTSISRTGATGVTIDAMTPIGAMEEVGRVRSLPATLGAFLALPAIAAAGHALITAGRRRLYDIAVLRVLGTTRWQVRWVLLTHSSVLALIGLVFGIPLGVALGRVLWRMVADFLPLKYVPPLAPGMILLVIPAAFLLAFLLGAWPAQRAACSRVADVLRAE